MGRTFVYQGVTLTVPDAYSSLNLDALLTPASGGTGIIALVGESDQGPPGLTVIPGGSSPTVVQGLLGTGPGANMARLALRSGSDPLVQAGASMVIFSSTNTNTQATANLGSGPAGVFTTKQYGTPTNGYTGFTTSVGGGVMVTIQQNAPTAKSIVESSPVLGASGYFSLSYTGNGTAATATFHYVSSVLRLQTVLTGQTDSSAALNIAITAGMTVQQLVTLINNQAGYVAVVLNNNGQVLVSNLDLFVSAQDIKAAPVNFVASLFELTNWAASTSQLVTFVRATGDAGASVPAPFPTTGQFVFSGGTRGVSSNSTVQSAFDALLPLRVNIVVPLFSSDDQDGSTVTIASVNSILKSHVESRSAILGRSEAQGYVSIHGNLTAFLAECSRLSSMFVAVTSQQITDLDINGNLVQFPEYAFAVVCAQTQAGSPIGTPLENRIIPISGLTQDASWNPIVNASQVITGGGLFAWVDPSTNLFTIKGGYTCWLGDTNNGRIFIETVESLIIFAFNHRAFMKQRFLGKSVFTTADILAAIKESEANEKDSVKSIKDFDPKGVVLQQASAGVIQYTLSVVPWEGIRFILPTVVAVRSF